MSAFGLPGSARSSAWRCAAAGLAAWAITVAPVVLASRAPLGASVLGWLALAAGLAGPPILPRRPQLARALGIVAFVALSTGAWLLGSRAGVSANPEALRGVSGVVAWALVAASWVHPWSVPESHLADAPSGTSTGWTPRRRTPRTALVLGALGVVGAVVVLALAWQVEDSGRAVWARAIAVLAAVASLSGSSALAVALARDVHHAHARSPGRRAAFAIALLAVGIVAFAQAVVALARTHDLLAISALASALGAHSTLRRTIQRLERS